MNVIKTGSMYNNIDVNVFLVGGEVRRSIRGVVPEPDVLPVLLHVPRARHAHAARVYGRARTAFHRRHAHHRQVSAL